MDLYFCQSKNRYAKIYKTLCAKICFAFSDYEQDKMQFYSNENFEWDFETMFCSKRFIKDDLQNPKIDLSQMAGLKNELNGLGDLISREKKAASLRKSALPNFGGNQQAQSCARYLLTKNKRAAEA